MFAEREFEVNGEKVVVRALSFYELMTKVPAVIGRIAEKVKVAGKEINASVLIEQCSEEVFTLLSTVTGKEKEFWQKVPAEKGLEILTAFLELNLTENFLKTLPRLIEVGKQIGLKLRSG
jgi:hypothetical protein